MNRDKTHYKGFSKEGVRTFTYEAFIKAHSFMGGVDLDDVFKVCGGKMPEVKKPSKKKKKKSEEE